jgi:hypothetical protein
VLSNLLVTSGFMTDAQRRSCRRLSGSALRC